VEISSTILDGGIRWRRVVSRLGRFTPEERAPGRRLDASQSRCGRCGKKNNLLLLLGNEPRQPRPLPVAIPIELSRLLK
jgi:hypothetical protein